MDRTREAPARPVKRGTENSQAIDASPKWVTVWKGDRYMKDWPAIERRRFKALRTLEEASAP